MNGFASVLFPQLLAQSPALLACLVGGILALVYWPQHRRPCLFLGGGCLLYLLASIASSTVSAYLIAHANEGGTHVAVATQMAALGLVSGLVHAAALGLMVVAALVDRRVRG
jgi:hypothetical protein